MPVRAICVLKASGGSGGIAGSAQWILRRQERTVGAARTPEAERHSRSMPRITIRDSDLLRDSPAESQRIAKAFGLVWPKPHDEADGHHEFPRTRASPSRERVFRTAFRRLCADGLYRRTGCSSREVARANMDLRSSTACTASWRHTYGDVAACWLERIRKHRSRKRANPAPC